MTDAELLPYFAGFFDGEGTISIRRSDLRSYPQHFITISCSQNERYVLDLFQARFGGQVYSQKWVNAAKVFYSWQITKQEGKKRFLEILSPFLIVKKREAELGLALIATNRRGNRWHMSPEAKAEWIARRDALVAESKAIKRGRTILGIREAARN